MSDNQLPALPKLHLMRVAVGCPDVATLRLRLEGLASNGCLAITTRYTPRRADELIGGSLYWNIGHQLVARQTILGFGTAADKVRALIYLDRNLVDVIPRAQRAHQGWRYLKVENAPADLASMKAADEMPIALRQQLANLGLL